MNLCTSNFHSYSILARKYNLSDSYTCKVAYDNYLSIFNDVLSPRYVVCQMPLVFWHCVTI